MLVVLLCQELVTCIQVIGLLILIGKEKKISKEKKKHLPGLYTFKTRLTADCGQI